MVTMTTLAADTSGLFADFPMDTGPGSPLRAGLSLIGSGDMVRIPDGEGAPRLGLYGHLGIAANRVVTIRQVHSQDVLCVTTPGGPLPGEADGLVTGNREVVLGVTVADCLPVFLYSDDGQVFGIVHSGWRGTGIAGKAVELMVKTWGIHPPSIRAIIGPGIGACCYDVPQERADFFAEKFGSSAVRSAGGRVFLDLVRANITVLESAGVTGITVADHCTSCTPALGSFRREGPGSFTRMLALVGDF